MDPPIPTKARFHLKKASERMFQAAEQIEKAMEQCDLPTSESYKWIQRLRDMGSTMAGFPIRKTLPDEPPPGTI